MSHTFLKFLPQSQSNVCTKHLRLGEATCQSVWRWWWGWWRWRWSFWLVVSDVARHENGVFPLMTSWHCCLQATIWDRVVIWGLLHHKCSPSGTLQGLFRVPEHWKNIAQVHKKPALLASVCVLLLNFSLFW